MVSQDCKGEFDGTGAKGESPGIDADVADYRQSGDVETGSKRELM